MEKNRNAAVRGRSRRTAVTVAFSSVIVLVMVASSVGPFAWTTSVQRSAAGPMGPAAVHPGPVASLAASAGTPWTYPTTTQQEPNYTGGEYVMGTTEDVEYLNLYRFTDLYSTMILQELYDSANVFSPNETYIPWAASSYTEAPAPAGMTTFDPVTGLTSPVSYIWTVNLRPGIQWSDWNTSTASSTYVYSNHTSFSLWNSTTSSVQSFSHTYTWPSVTMSTDTMQSADLILSWEILESSADYGGNWANIVNVVPTSNLTAEYYLSSQSATFVTFTLGSPIIPYHVWVHHDWSDSNSAAWNYTGTGSPNGYDSWDVGYNPSTGRSSELIGSGPFMFSNNYGSPQGAWVTGQYWDLFVNPHYFVQYVPGLRQWTPKIYEIYAPLYLSESNAVAAVVLGQVDTLEEGNGVDPTFLPTLTTAPNTEIFYEPTGNFGFVELGVNNAPFNITAFRQALNYATNKAYLASVIGEGYDVLGQPTVPVADSIWHNYSTPQYAFSLSTASSLIAGIPGMAKNGAGNWLYNGQPVTVKFEITSAALTPLAVEGALIVAKDWDSIGIPTTVTQEAFSTLVTDLVTYNYQAVDLSITGVQGDPTGDFLDFYNSVIGTPTGFYEGPYSSLTIGGKALTGAQVTSLMDNLTIELNSITNFTQRLNIAYEIEGIAAQESTLINLGYPIAILPFVNATFTGWISDSLAYSSFMYFNFLALHEKTGITVTPPSTIPTELHVGVVSPQTVYTDGQFGNITVQVRNQYGAPVPGMNVTLGFKPAGQLINISSDSGVTNAQGKYTWEFDVFPSNPTIYTTDYSGSINISAGASKPAGSSLNIIGGLGWTVIDVQPAPAAFRAPSVPVLVSGASATPYSITVYNPLTGAPIAGYAYTLEALSGAVVMTSGASGQTVSQLANAGFESVQVGQSSDSSLTSISGTTGANGLITVDLKANASANFTAMGSSFGSWLFIGNYGSTAPLSGVQPYDVFAEITSSFDPGGYGAAQPVEIPLTVASAAVPVHLSISVTGGSADPTGSLTVTVVATNATSSAAVPNFHIDLTSQNVLGANRGVLSSATGTPIQGYNPNNYFGSTFLPGVALITNATGVATATFSPEFYTPGYVGSAFTGYTTSGYTDPYLVPFDEFEIGATGARAGTVSVQVNSSAMVHSVAPVPTATAFVQGSSSLGGLTTVVGNATYTLFVNTTANTPWGPSVGNIPVAISTSLGTLGTANGTTSSSGTFSTTFTAPSVSVLTAVTVTTAYTPPGSNVSVRTVQTLFLLPSPSTTSTTPPPPSKSSSTSNSAEVYGLAAATAIFAILTVVFAAMWYSSRKKPPPAQAWTPASASMPSSTSSPSGTPPTPPGSGPPSTP